MGVILIKASLVALLVTPCAVAQVVDSACVEFPSNSCSVARLTRNVNILGGEAGFDQKQDLPFPGTGIQWCLADWHSGMLVEYHA